MTASPTDDHASAERRILELTKELAQARGELEEAREQQNATAGILTALSSSPADLRRVCAEIAANAAHLCDAYDALIRQVDGEVLRLVAHHGPIPVSDTLPLTRGLPPAHAILDRRTIHITDLLTETDEFPEGSDRARSLGFRTLLAVPLVHASEAIGVISIRRPEVRPFTDRQIELLKTFADQAVIAIENTRLLEAEQARTREVEVKSTELARSLEYQTAISEVLGVISRSPNELQPVFNTIVASSKRLLRAHSVGVTRVVGNELRLAAFTEISPETDRVLQNVYPMRLDASGPVFAAIHKRTHFMIEDMEADDGYPRAAVEVARLRGYRSILFVPMLSKGVAIGTVNVTRPEPGSFSDEEIGLLKTFADQAVIAIDNARLFEAEQASKRELQESLEYQTATSDVLGVISRSKFDLQPVLNTIVKIASGLCAAEDVAILLRENGVLRVAAHDGTIMHQLNIEVPVERGYVAGRTVVDRRPIQVPDLTVAGEEFPLGHGIALRLGIRTSLGIPLLREEIAIGCLLLRRKVVRPFDEKQIALLQTFADQAVIAIENTRLFEEVQARTRDLVDSLEHATATSEVLKVISTSAFDLRPVLESLIENAVRLCGADKGLIYRQDGDVYRAVVSCGHAPEWQRVIEQNPIAQDRTSATGRAVIDRRVVHIHDTLADPDYRWAERHHGEQGMHRTILAVPMLREDVVIGVIVIRRTWVEPFTDRQIELVTTFADQAVIAIENTRLFEAEQAQTRNLSIALQRQTATSEILGIISASPGQLEPVFNAILERARELCAAKFGHLLLLDGQAWRAAALHNVPPAYAEFWRSASPAALRVTLLSRLLETKQPYQVEDLRLSEAYRMRVPLTAATVELAGARTLLGVPLVKDGLVIGAIVLYRTEVHPFDERQIALLSSFTDQAVIAIENTRLFEAEQASKRELTEALEQQTATADVLKVISRSAFDLQVVLDTLAESAARLCDADHAWLFRREGEFYRWAASYGLSNAIHEPIKQHMLNQRLSSGRGTIVGRTVLEGRPVQIADVLADREYAPRDSQQIAGFRTLLGAPLLRESVPIGVLVAQRTEVRPFTDRQIELLQTFADQAVIAIENARLFEEVQAQTRELAKTVENLEIASQHKSQFVANMSHELRTPLAAILGYAELMQEGFYEPLGQKSLDALTRIRSNGKHLLGLINTVLDIAKIESGQFTLNMSEYAIESVVETVRSATESLAQNKKLTLTTSVDKPLPIGLGDEQRLTQVLLNLVGNAIKFTDVGEVSIAAGARNGHFAVSVTDTGPGIPFDQQDRIFEQFHQVDSSNTKANGGTGLGLAIAKQIVEMHGGRIWVVSTPGKGSTFQMELPTRAQFHKKTP